MTAARIAVWVVNGVTLAALGLVCFGIVLSIGMSKSGPSATEAFREYWPVGTALVLAASAMVLNRQRPSLALLPTAGAAGLTLWVFKVMIGL